MRKAPRFLFLYLITLYQYTLSPDHGVPSYFVSGQCKFYPTCSEYTKKMVKKHGIIKGTKQGLKQLKKCY